MRMRNKTCGRGFFNSIYQYISQLYIKCQMQDGRDKEILISSERRYPAHIARNNQACVRPYSNRRVNDGVGRQHGTHLHNQRSA